MTQVTAHAPDRTAHAILRAATDGAHRRVDALAAGLDLSRTADYLAFLLAQAAALLPLEDALRDGSFATVCPGWRPRAPALRAAIDALGGRTAPGPAVSHGASPAALWGIAYVVEGSRLGGRLLARTAGAGDAGGDATAMAFLTERPNLSWPVFTARLNTALADAAAHTAASAAALMAFDRFADAMVPPAHAKPSTASWGP